MLLLATPAATSSPPRLSAPLHPAHGSFITSLKLGSLTIPAPPTDPLLATIIGRSGPRAPSDSALAIPADDAVDESSGGRSGRPLEAGALALNGRGRGRGGRAEQLNERDRACEERDAGGWGAGDESRGLGITKVVCLWGARGVRVGMWVSRWERRVGACESDLDMALEAGAEAGVVWGGPE